MKHAGRDIADLELPQLEAILNGLQIAESQREKARLHHKFDKVSNKKALEFPPINPNFLKLKNAIVEEIKNRKANI